MKNAKNKLSILLSGIISIILSMLGFSSCDDINGGGDPICEYGTPSAKFKITGKVVSEGNKNPIKDLQVTLQEYDTWKDGIGNYYEQKSQILTIKTGTDGSFVFDYGGFPTSKKYIYLIEDIDDDLNGNFETKKDSILFTNPKYKNGSGNWYKGETEKDFGTIEVKAKKPD